MHGYSSGFKSDKDVVSRLAVGANPSSKINVRARVVVAVYYHDVHTSAAAVEGNQPLPSVVKGDAAWAVESFVVELEDAHGVGVGRARHRSCSPSIDVTPASQPIKRRAAAREIGFVQRPPNGVRRRDTSQAAAAGTNGDDGRRRQAQHYQLDNLVGQELQTGKIDILNFG
eukprot:TRINITY_DN559_c0_g11_i1.p3 TRINITY_DN559_c0_g11~~TRINITY_DN559_c0_g11_i1.p3  ORF type:complete len:171 (+),score=30.43 TRINITY_DN559_c0_g11_i1:633-1145(+)